MLMSLIEEGRNLVGAWQGLGRRASCHLAPMAVDLLYGRANADALNKAVAAE
jgi:hypothetical protein